MKKEKCPKNIEENITIKEDSAQQGPDLELSSDVFTCPENGCLSMKYSNLLNHLSCGRHAFNAVDNAVIKDNSQNVFFIDGNQDC